MKFSIFNDEQSLLIGLLDLHNKGCPIELDPMFFKGNFYKTIPLPTWRFDINPIKNLYKRCRKGDARSLPFKDGQIESMVLDPPFMFGIHGKAESYYSSKTHGILKDYDALKSLYQSILKESFRILKKKGLLIFKCQDYTDSKTTMTHCLVWKWATAIGFYPKDLAILNLPKGKIYNPNLKQRHLRKVHSYFWIFKK